MRSDGRVWLACLVWVVFAPLAKSAEWKLSGTLDQGFEYDDNIAMRVDASPAFGYLLRPSLAANWGTEIMNIGVNGRGDIRRYDDERWDCDNMSFGLNQQYTQHRHVFSLAADYGQSCSYSQQASDTGVLVPNNQMENYNLAPAWNWQWTPLDRLSLSPVYSQTNFSAIGASDDLANNLGFQNNTTYSVDLSEEHQWNRLLSLTGGLFFSHSEYGNGSGSSQNVSGFQLGAQYIINRSWSANASGGGRWVQYPSNNASENSGDSLMFTQVANLGVQYKGDLLDSSLSYARSVNPSAFGQALEYNSINMRSSYQITRELLFNLDGSFMTSQTAGQSINQASPDRTYYTVSTGLVWRFAKEWRLSTSYSYRWQEYANPESGVGNTNLYQGAQQSNSVMLHLNYNWDGLRVSR